MSAYQAPIVTKAFLLLNLISKNPEGSGISEMARALDMSKGTVYGIAAALEEAGALVRDPVSKRYSLGFSLVELGRSARKSSNLNAAARPHMKGLMERFNASVFLGVLNRSHVTVIDVVESEHELKITSPAGSTVSLLAGAVGKVFLSGMENRRVDEILEAGRLSAYTVHSIVDPAIYKEAVELVRTCGFALDDEEYILGVRAAAALVDGPVPVPAAIWVVGFKTDLAGSTMELLGRAAKATADAIAEELKARGR
jgi:IclR family transcriptional regulator, KDG regulon repressor